MRTLRIGAIVFAVFLWSSAVGARAQGLGSDSPVPEQPDKSSSNGADPAPLVSSGAAQRNPSAPERRSGASLPSAVPSSLPTDRTSDQTPPEPPAAAPGEQPTLPLSNGLSPRQAPSGSDDTAAAVAGLPGKSSTDTDQILPGDDYPRLRPEEYVYGEGPRYTLSGSLPYRTSHLKTGTTMAFGGALLALATSITWYQQAWYPDSTKAPFHFQTDWGYSKQFDKAGHMFGGWMSSYCSYESFVACGLSPDDAALWGSIGGLFFQTFMEVQDGFFSYGFDPTDELSNIIGAGYFYAQHHVPLLQNFDPKWSFGPNPRDSAREAAQIRSRIIADDYDRQDVWMSVRVHNLLPESLKPYWPKWLQLALGAGARDVELIGYTSHRELHLALDYNLVELLPDLGSFGNWLIQGLNHFKLPAPALRLWPTVGFELVYPFHL